MIDVEVEDEAWTRALPNAEALARNAALAAFAFPIHGEGGPSAVEPRVERAGRHLAGEANITLLLTDDDSVRALNAAHRGQDKPTNVLSFPALPNPHQHLGDIALAYGVCAREAAEQGKTLGQHLQHMAVHGVLHLLGYDHMSDDEAEVMEDLERAVLAGLGIPDPYEAGEGEHDRP